LNTLVMKGTDCMGSCISNYHTITTMTAPYTAIIIIIYIYTGMVVKHFQSRWHTCQIIYFNNFTILSLFFCVHMLKPMGNSTLNIFVIVLWMVLFHVFYSHVLLGHESHYNCIIVIDCNTSSSLILCGTKPCRMLNG
jgi:hypothetical protein